MPQRIGYLYQVPYRAIFLRPDEGDNLLVSVALSCTHVAMLSLRIEVTRMLIGQSADITAALAKPHDIAVRIPTPFSSQGSKPKARCSRPGQLDEAFEFADAGGVAHFAEGLGFDLADPFAGDLELAADFEWSAGSRAGWLTWSTFPAGQDLKRGSATAG